ncbi:MAG: ATP-binding protein [Minicystis sp.]
MSSDNRLQAFLSSPLDVFHPVEHRHEIWREDPFDVETIHAEARAEFRSLISHATTPPGQERGQIMLLRGNAGAGKTHLLRAFRNEVHSERSGLVGYMPMTSQSTNYARYILSNLIDSLDQPYDEITDTRSGLVRLAGILASRALPPELANHLRDEPDLGAEEIADIVTAGAEKLLAEERYASATLDLMRALLFLHRPDPRIKTRVLMYLRCEDSQRGRSEGAGRVEATHRRGAPRADDLAAREAHLGHREHGAGDLPGPVRRALERRYIAEREASDPDRMRSRGGCAFLHFRHLLPG